MISIKIVQRSYISVRGLLRPQGLNVHDLEKYMAPTLAKNMPPFLNFSAMCSLLILATSEIDLKCENVTEPFQTYCACKQRSNTANL